jgi:hypothetical protein
MSSTIAESCSRSTFCQRSSRSLAAEKAAVPRVTAQSAPRLKIANCWNCAPCPGSAPSDSRTASSPAASAYRTTKYSSECHTAIFNPVRYDQQGDGDDGPRSKRIGLAAPPSRGIAQARNAVESSDNSTSVITAPRRMRPGGLAPRSQPGYASDTTAIV